MELTQNAYSAKVIGMGHPNFWASTWGRATAAFAVGDGESELAAQSHKGGNKTNGHDVCYGAAGWTFKAGVTALVAAGSDNHILRVWPITPSLCPRSNDKGYRRTEFLNQNMAGVVSRRGCALGVGCSPQ